MDYSMTKPCPKCPFRKEGGVRLRRARIREIAGMMLHPQGGEFPCHKTVDYGGGEESDLPRDGEAHCAGALIFAEQQGKATQMMRIAGRLGTYDPEKFTGEARASVFGSMREMLATAIP